jgi:hypothetical protein
LKHKLTICPVDKSLLTIPIVEQMGPSGSCTQILYFICTLPVTFHEKIY